MTCHLCKTKPEPYYYASPRKCAFDEAGNFTPDNWNCETMNELRNRCAVFDHTNLDDSSVVVADERGDPDDGNGHIVLTIYKRRGAVNGAIVVGESKQAKPLTLDVAERTIGHHSPR